jgi:Chaperone of endosialidase
VLQLRPVRWQWKNITTTQLNLGLVAQDVEPVLPELILRNVDTQGSLGLNYGGFIPVLINAIQERQDTITALTAENARLDVRLRALEQALLHPSQAQ